MLKNSSANANAPLGIGLQHIAMKCARGSVQRRLDAGEVLEIATNLKQHAIKMDENVARVSGEEKRVPRTKVK